jgi:predicted dehydrogenase
MVKEARQIIQSGKLGAVRKIIVEFMQGWLATCVEGENHKQAVWRMDAKTALSGTIADIGSHAFHLAEYIKGLRAEAVCADVNKTIPHRALEDDGAVFIQYDSGAHGVLIASQIAAGEEADINIRVYGENGSLKWTHTDPGTLLIKYLDKPAQIIKAGRDYHFLHPATLSNCRTPSGHPEAFVEAFANHYRNVALCIKAAKNKMPMQPAWEDFPGIEAGVRGVAFIETAIASGHAKEKWLRMVL